MIVTVSDPFVESFKKVLRAASAASLNIPSYRQLLNINGVHKALSEQGLWTEIDCIQLPACGTGSATTEVFSKYNHKDTNNFTLVKVGSPTFDGVKGWKMVSTSSYVSQNFNPFSNGVKTARFDNSAYCWRYDNVIGTGYCLAGTSNAGNDNLRFRLSSDGINRNFNYQDVSGDYSFGTPGTSAGSFHLKRTSSTAILGFVNGIQIGATNTSDNGSTRQLPNITMALGYHNASGTLSNVDTTSFYSAVIFGSGSLDPVKLHTIMNRYMTNIT